MQKTKLAQSLNFVELFARANVAYISRHPTDANLCEKTGLNPSIKQGLQYAQQLTEAQLNALAAIGVNWEDVANGIATAPNVKKAMRAPQFLRFIASGDGSALQMSSRTALLGFCSLMIDTKDRNGLYFVVTGKGDENTSDCVNVARAREVQKAFGKIGVSSAQTTVSVAFSKGGLLPMLGLCDVWGGKGKPLPKINDTKLARALVQLISTASESKIELWAAQSASKGK